MKVVMTSGMFLPGEIPCQGCAINLSNMSEILWCKSKCILSIKEFIFHESLAALLFNLIIILLKIAYMIYFALFNLTFIYM